MSTDTPGDSPSDPNEPTEPDAPTNGSGDGGGTGERIRTLDIQEEMRNSYLTYAMSVIVSRALPDARDGLKPAQRRILVAMNDLNLGPSSGRVKCSKITGDTNGNYHPHGDAAIYPTLVRMAQTWVMRERLIDPQGNFGNLAGLPAAAQRYTEARLASAAADMMADIDRDTVDYVATYDQRGSEPTVLPSRFPNLLVNGSSGIAVGMRTSIPPHNVGEVCDAVVMQIDNPDCTVDEIMTVLPGPDFPTGGIICGRYNLREAYTTGRSKIILRAKTHFEVERKRDVIVVTEIPYTKTRDDIKEKLEELVRKERVKGIHRVVDLTDRRTPPWQVRLHIELKNDADKEVVLNQLFRYSPLQDTISVILLALVGNRPETLSIKALIREFLRHRVTVIRRKTEYLLREARRRKHIVEGLLLAQIDIDQIITTIRNSPSRAEARNRLMDIKIPAELIERALGEVGFRDFQNDQGVHVEYSLSQRQTEAIVSMQLGSLANLEREQLAEEHRGLLEKITEYLHLLSDEAHIEAVVRDEMLDLKRKYSDSRRTEISDLELENVDRDALITEEPMTVTITQRGYIKRTPLSEFQAQNRGGKGIKGGKADEEDPVEHLFVCSTHSYLLFFTDGGKVYWQKVYDLPELSRTAKGRALINLLQLQDSDEKVLACVAVREFTDDAFLLMATRKGLVKKTALSAYSRPMKGGIIAINLDDDDSLIESRIVTADDDVVLSTARGMAIRFHQSDARAMGRNTRGVKGINLVGADEVVGMVVADADRELLTICENGYGKRTPFGDVGAFGADDEADDASDTEGDSDSEASPSSSRSYRRQKRGGKGVRDIKTTDRNGPVIATLSVDETDDVLMVSAEAKIQRIRVADVSQLGRNTQGVRIMSLGGDDHLVSCARIPVDLERELAAEAEANAQVEVQAIEATESDAEPDVVGEEE